MKALSLIVFGLLAVIGLTGLIGDYNNLKLPFALIPIAMVVVPAFFILKITYADYQEDDLRSYLLKNRDALDDGTLRYKGFPVTADTKVYRYLFTVSVVIATIKLPSQYYFENRCNRTFLAAWHTMLSFVFGWWGFPWGIPYTIQSIIFNVKGGQALTLHDVMFSTGK